ncbi:MAG: 50S ribosomal protein L35, partial [candidate division NC10 bacterium]
MPKLKTHRGAAKRLKVTGSGKIRRRKAGKSHLLTGKGRRRLRRLR